MENFETKRLRQWVEAKKDELKRDKSHTETEEFRKEGMEVLLGELEEKLNHIEKL